MMFSKINVDLAINRFHFKAFKGLMVNKQLISEDTNTNKHWLCFEMISSE